MWLMMNLKKPKFWDYKKPNIYAYLLLPFAFVLKILILLKKKMKKEQINLIFLARMQMEIISRRIDLVFYNPKI